MVTEDHVAPPAPLKGAPPPEGSRILSAAASGIREQVIRDGGDPDEVIALSRIDARLLGGDRNPLELGAYVRMMEIAARRTGNDNFGLHYGQRFTPSMLGLIGRIALASPTLGAALANVAQLFGFHQQATEVCLARDGELGRLEYRILNGRIINRRQDAELTMGMFVNIIRGCLGPRWSPEEVHCEHPRPEQWRAHERVFDAPVYFAQRTNAVVFRAGELERRMPGADMPLLATLSEDLRRVAGGTGRVGLVDQVRSEIRSCLPEGGGTVGSVADAVAIPRWTLKRRLALHGYNFSDLVDEVRRDLADRYIRRPDLPLTDIAFLLGYAELSAFSRAYSRWHGLSPQQHRSQRRRRISDGAPSH